MNLRIFPPEEIAEDIRIAIPASKSLSTRALIMNALTPGFPAPSAIAECDDTAVIAEALTRWHDAPAEHHTFDLKASGAALRFLTAFFASQEGAHVTLTGCERLLQRPVAPLVEALRSCGAEISGDNAPLEIHGHKLRGGTVEIDSTISSQFISALAMVAPSMTEGLEINLTGEPVSLPYIIMTLEMMRQRSVESERLPLRITIPSGEYRPFSQPADGDWSAAAVWLELSAMASVWLTVDNLSENSLQGDRRGAQLFQCLGCVCSPSEDIEGAMELSPTPDVYGRLDADLSDTPDLMPYLVVTCCILGIPFRLTGLRTLALKESDRREALCREMAKVGCILEPLRDFGLEWEGRRHPVTELPRFSAHGDHRIAMALAPAAFYLPGLVIEQAETVSKSYPEFWQQLKAIGFTLTDGDAPIEDVMPENVADED